MTMPDERYRSIRQAEEFLQKLMITKRIPKELKQYALGVLRHYPREWELDMIARRCPELLMKEIEPVTRLMMQYENSLTQSKE